MTVLKSIQVVARRAPYGLVQDAIGAASLAVILVVGLHLPNLI